MHGVKLQSAHTYVENRNPNHDTPDPKDHRIISPSKDKDRACLLACLLVCLSYNNFLTKTPDPMDHRRISHSKDKDRACLLACLLILQAFLT